MKQNDTINILLLFFCILLLGFVYVNSKMADDYNTAAREDALIESQILLEEPAGVVIE